MALSSLSLLNMRGLCNELEGKKVQSQTSGLPQTEALLQRDWRYAGDVVTTHKWGQNGHGSYANSITSWGLLLGEHPVIPKGR